MHRLVSVAFPTSHQGGRWFPRGISSVNPFSIIHKIQITPSRTQRPLGCGTFVFSHHRTVAAPLVAIQLFKGLGHAGPDRVEVNISDQGKQIVVFITQNGFIAVLEQVARALVPPVVVNRLPREKLAHDRRYPLLPALEKNMHMIGHEDPCVDRALRFDNLLSQSLQEFVPVLIITEDICLIIPANHDMVQCSGDI